MQELIIMASTNTFKLISGPILTRANYEFCSIKMNTFLQLNKFWDMVETEFKELYTNSLAAMNNAQKNALKCRQDRDLTSKWLIQSCIEESIFPRI